MKKTKVLVAGRKASREEMEYYEKIFKEENRKYERDRLAGGISEDGCYIRLHDRGVN